MYKFSPYEFQRVVLLVSKCYGEIRVMKSTQATTSFERLCSYFQGYPWLSAHLYIQTLYFLENEYFQNEAEYLSIYAHSQTSTGPGTAFEAAMSDNSLSMSRRGTLFVLKHFIKCPFQRFVQT